MSQPELDFTSADSTSGDLPEGTYTVSELAELISHRLRAGLDHGVWVRGEIQGWNARGPHAYFALADDQSATKAIVNVAFFAPQRERLRSLLKRNNLTLGDGMKVLVHGFLDYYAPTGRLTLKMDGLSPRYTLGDLAQQRDQVVRRLVARGLIDANKRHRLSPVPLRIGVVTSVGSAAWHDFEHELARSGVGFQLSVCDVRVQGATAAPMVAAAIATLGRRPLDAVAVIRGGGARNELAVFDSEEIAVAIATAAVPVVTGLGHEVDRSVADEVAHTAHKTPTACAQAFVHAAHEYRRRTEQVFAEVIARSGERLTGAEQRVGECAHRIARRTHAAVGRADESLAMRATALRRTVLRQLADAEQRLAQAAAKLRAAPQRTLHAEQRHVEGLAARVRALDPAGMLARGWTITRRPDGTVLKSPAGLHAGDRIETQFASGRLASHVAGPMSAGDEPANDGVSAT